MTPKTEYVLRSAAAAVAAAQPQLALAFPQLTWLWTILGLLAGATAFKSKPVDVQKVPLP